MIDSTEKDKKAGASPGFFIHRSIFLHKAPCNRALLEAETSKQCYFATCKIAYSFSDIVLTLSDLRSEKLIWYSSSCSDMESTTLAGNLLYFLLFPQDFQYTLSLMV